MSFRRRRGGHPDEGQAAIVAALRSAGASVEIISTVGFGCPDLLVGYRERNYLLEVKPGNVTPSRQKLNAREEAWHRGWRGQVAVVRDVPEAMLAIGLGHTAAQCDDPTCRSHYKERVT